MRKLCSEKSPSLSELTAPLAVQAEIDARSSGDTRQSDRLKCVSVQTITHRTHRTCRYRESSTKLQAPQSDRTQSSRLPTPHFCHNTSKHIYLTLSTRPADQTSRPDQQQITRPADREQLSPPKPFHSNESPDSGRHRRQHMSTTPSANTHTRGHVSLCIPDGEGKPRF